MNKIMSLVLVALLGMSTSAVASETYELASPYYLGVLGTYADPDEDRDFGTAVLEEGDGVSLLFGKQKASGWGYEVRGWYQIFESGNAHSTDFYNYGIGADLTYAFGDRTSFTPFILVGGGAAYNDVDPNTVSEDDYAAFGNVGVGFVTGPVIEVGQIRIRGEARYVYEDFSDGYGEMRYGLGIEVPLFKSKRAASVDGDSDRDGIVDSQDQCPATPQGTRVDHVGCKLKDVIVLRGVLFDFDKTTLRAESTTTLDNNLDVLRRYPEIKVEIAGHTDATASDAYNLQLSQGRASTVMKYFTDRGISSDRLDAKGYGESEPVADNNTKQGRAQNRRVEIRILN